MFHRIAGAIPALVSLAMGADLSSGSTPFGLAHIFCSLTVTNKQLLAEGLAEKGIDTEQFKQLQELHRVKGKDGVEEPKVRSP